MQRKLNLDQTEKSAIIMTPWAVDSGKTCVIKVIKSQARITA